LSRYRYLIGIATIHLLLVLIVCLRDTFGLFAEARTIFPAELNRSWDRAATFCSTALGEELDLQNPFRQTAAAYLNAAGVEAGYGFFAPNVPNNYKLAFEVRHTPDGHRTYEVPRVADSATGFRLESLLDRIADLDYEPMRQTMIQMLVKPVWQRNPDAVSIRAVLGYVIWPSADEYLRGEKETFEPVRVYDFDVSPGNRRSQSPQ
jgi:hypothetical protein